MKMLNLKNEELERLDIACSKVLPHTRSAIKKAIKHGSIQLEGKKATPHILVSKEDTVLYDPSFFEIPEVDTSKAPKLNIIFEDDDVLVVNKPAGLMVHKTDTSSEVTLVDSLIQYFPEITSVGEDPDRPGIVHRLDKDASGVMIVAKNQEAFIHLKHQFKLRRTKKIYTVAVEGVVTDPVGMINFPIGRSKSHGRMAARPLTQGGKEAITKYTVMKNLPHQTLLRVHIETGRTHQIRVHFFSLGHPVVGDTLYRIKGKTPRNIGRLFLHATELTIELPSGETTIFEAALPEELEKTLADFPTL